MLDQLESYIPRIQEVSDKETNCACSSLGEEQPGKGRNNESLQQVKSLSILTNHLGRVDKVRTYVWENYKMILNSN